MPTQCLGPNAAINQKLRFRGYLLKVTGPNGVRADPESLRATGMLFLRCLAPYLDDLLAILQTVCTLVFW